ncbi:MAG TPA: carboxypeptidase-like regulatory domain-containing protein [Bryobacteraceae bacterium]|nr:carboxypeptidase-like regulatory domain-containing protein [Bryobacteraceae bacterium]
MTIQLAGLMVALAWQTVAQNVGVVEGTVRNSVTHAAIGGVTVTLGDAGYRGTTDAFGAFRILEVRAGKYTAKFTCQGFLPPPASDPAARPFVVNPDRATRVEAEMIPLAKISGRVTEREDRPAARIQVELHRFRRGSVESAMTDRDGQFTLSDIEPGSYLLVARPILAGTSLGGHAERISPLRPPEGERAVWSPTWFPLAAERSGAERIVVRAGAELSGFNVRLLTSPVYRVRGVVLDEEGKRVAGASVVLVPTDEWDFLAETRTTSAKEGEFEFPTVRPGEWSLLADAKRDTVVLKGFGRVFVSDHDSDPLEVRVARAFTWSGFVEREEPRDADGKRKVTAVYLLPADGTPGARYASFHEQDGSLRFKAVYQGRYRIYPAGNLPGYYMESVRIGDRDVTAQAVDITPGMPPVHVVYRPDAGRVGGTVEQGEGATVVLVPRDESFMNDQFIRWAVCGRGGRFEVGSLRPGNYYAFAFDRVDLNAMEDRSFVRGLAFRAASVQVERNQVSSVELRVTAWPE